MANEHSLLSCFFADKCNKYSRFERYAILYFSTAGSYLFWCIISLISASFTDKGVPYALQYFITFFMMTCIFNPIVMVLHIVSLLSLSCPCFEKKSKRRKKYFRLYRIFLILILIFVGTIFILAGSGILSPVFQTDDAGAIWFVFS